MKNFDPNAAAMEDSGIFGLPFKTNEAKLILLPVPWEVTTSYGRGTANGPQAILQASRQVDLYDYDLANFFMAGIAMLDESKEVQQWNKAARQAAQLVIDAGGVTDGNQTLQMAVAEVNAYSARLNEYVYNTTKQLLDSGKCVGVVGGDHSTPFGAMCAFLEKYPRMAILHFDAHADMRQAYEGFEHSHASIMYNIISKTQLSKLVPIGIRDFCEEELLFMKQHPERITAFFDAALMEQKLSGVSWGAICNNIMDHLPEEVYVSFDIDGLDPRFCPHTGTPVPGGLDFSEALYLLKKIVLSGRKIIGFDLNEVAPSTAPAAETAHPDPSSEWDANVGARLLYKLCGWTLKSHGLLKAH